MDSSQARQFKASENAATQNHEKLDEPAWKAKGRQMLLAWLRTGDLGRLVNELKVCDYSPILTTITLIDDY